MISINLCLATLCALGPKRRWAFARRSAEHGRPWLSYLLSAVAAAVATLPVRLVYYLWREHGQWREALTGLQAGYGWMILPSVAALAIAFALDDRPEDLAFLRLGGASEASSKSRLRVVEAVALALLFSGGALLTLKFVPQVRSSPLTLVGIYAMLGLVLGFMVPAWHRDATARCNQTRATHHELPPDAHLKPALHDADQRAA